MEIRNLELLRGSILEKELGRGTRWDLQDHDGRSKEIRLSSRIGSVKAGNSIFREDWIDSGDFVER